MEEVYPALTNHPNEDLMGPITLSSNLQINQDFRLVPGSRYRTFGIEDIGR